MTAHSRMIGGSSAKRVTHCPGSWALGLTQPRQPSSSYADEGTMLHNAMAMILDAEVKSAKDVIGLTYSDHKLTEELYEEMIVPALALFDSLNLTEYVVETRVEFPSMDGEFGTADVIGYNDDFTVQLDWKFGRGVYVSPIKNDQQLYYGAAGRYSLPKWFPKDRPVRLYIVQPGFKSNMPYDEVSVQDLIDYEKKLIQTTRMMKKKNAPFQMGDWCQWCPASTVCPLKNKASMHALRHDGELPPKELGRWLAEDAPRLQELIDDRRALARSQIEAGHAVPGMKLVAKKLGNRVWADPEQIALDLRAFGRKFKVAEFYKHTLLGPAPIEKLLKKKHIPLTELGELDEIITRSSGGTNLVSDDAKGDAVVAGGAVFKKIAAAQK